MQSNNEINIKNNTNFFDKLNFIKTDWLPGKLNRLQKKLDSIQLEYLDTNQPHHLVEKYQKTLEELFPYLEPFYFELVPILTDLLFITAMEFYHEHDIKSYDKILMIQTLMQDVSYLCEQLEWPLIKFNPSSSFKKHQLVSKELVEKIKNEVDFFNILIYPLQVHNNIINSLPQKEANRYKEKVKNIAAEYYTSYKAITLQEIIHREQAIIVFNQIFENLNKMDLLSINTSIQSSNDNSSLEENLKIALEKCNNYKTKCFSLLKNLNQIDAYHQDVKEALYAAYHNAIEIESSDQISENEENEDIKEKLSATNSVEAQLAETQTNKASALPNLVVIKDPANEINTQKVDAANKNDESYIEFFETFPTNHVGPIPTSASVLENLQEEADTPDTEAAEEILSEESESETDTSKAIKGYYGGELRENNCFVFFKEAYQYWSKISDANCQVISEQFTKVEDRLEDLQKLTKAIQNILQRFSSQQIKEEAKASSPISPKKRKACTSDSGRRSPIKKFHPDTNTNITKEGSFENIKMKPQTLFFTSKEKTTNPNLNSVTPTPSNLPSSPSF